MSDSGKTILWVAVAVVVVGVIIWSFVSAARRREAESRRFEAGELRARVEERLPQVQDTQDRASVTAAVAAEARAEAEEKAAEARRLEEQARQDREAAESARAEHAGLQREADRIDPDVATDDEGYRIDAEEDDLADAENPFAPIESSRPGADGNRADEAGPDLATDADLDVAGHEEDSSYASEEPEVTAEPDAPMGGTSGTGTATEHPSDERSTTVSDTHPAAPDVTDATDSAGTAVPVPAPPVADADEPKEVVVPALADRGEVVAGGGTPTGDPGDHRGQSWATTPGEPGPGDGAEPTNEGVDVDMAPHSHASDETDDPDEPDEAVGEAAQTPRSQEAAAPGPATSGRRVSDFDEVVDGGFGLGSAAPLGDGAQPLGHAVKGTREGATFVGPGDAGYDDVEPDVWFYNEDAARRAGFRREGD